MFSSTSYLICFQQSCCHLCTMLLLQMMRKFLVFYLKSLAKETLHLALSNLLTPCISSDLSVHFLDCGFKNLVLPTSILSWAAISIRYFWMHIHAYTHVETERHTAVDCMSSLASQFYWKDALYWLDLSQNQNKVFPLGKEFKWTSQKQLWNNVLMSIYFAKNT